MYADDHNARSGARNKGETPRRRIKKTAQHMRSRHGDRRRQTNPTQPGGPSGGGLVRLACNRSHDEILKYALRKARRKESCFRTSIGGKTAEAP